MLTTDDDGAIELRATLGEYVAQWESAGEPRHARFAVERGPDALTVIGVDDATPPRCLGSNDLALTARSVYAHSRLI